jgi:exosome complex RNA-binding protein Csl4
MQTAQQVETFTGVVENIIAHRDIGWVRTDAGETLFMHKNYTLAHELPVAGTRVTGRIGRVEGEDKLARAFAVEVCNG